MSSQPRIQFSHRPELGQTYQGKNGGLYVIRAIWEAGVVFSGERCASAEELRTQHQPFTLLNR